MENHANEYVTTLGEAISSSDTSFDLADAPPASLASGNFRLRIGAADEADPEYIHVRAVSGSTVSGCTRGLEGSTAQSWASGDVVAQVMTRGALRALGNPLDDRILHPTYGDDYIGPTLDAKWTRRGLLAPSETFWVPSWMKVERYNSTNFGHLQAWTPTDEADVILAGSYFTTGDEGWGPVILDSAGTGVWLGFRNSTRFGLFAVTTYTTATEPSSDIDPPDGREAFGEGRKIWLRITKKGSVYYFSGSLDGATWTNEVDGWSPSAFTPDRIGWYQGVQNADYLDRVISLDWFDVVEGDVGNNLMITPTSGTVTPTANNSPAIGAVGNVIDGNLGGTGWGDNTSNTTIWWQAAFSVPQTINRLRIWGYTNAWGMGYVEFSSGTLIPFFCGASAIIHLDFPEETTSIVKVWCQQQGEGTFPGFYEIEAYLAS